MLENIKEEIIGEYKYITYSNGTVVKQSIHAVDTREEIEEEPQLSEGEQTQLETALNIEYLICLAELNS